jgi:hypothetical protein
MSVAELLGKVVGVFGGTLGVPGTLASAAALVAVVAAWRSA